MTEVAVAKEIADVSASVELELSLGNTGWSELLTWPTRFRLLLGLGVMVLSQMTGVNAIIYYAPEIFGMWLTS